MSILLDSYSESKKDYDGFQITTYGAFTFGELGQTFKTPNNGLKLSLSSVIFYLKKQTANTDSVEAFLYAHTGTFGTNGTPTGTVLATSDAVSLTTLSASDYSLITFTFSGVNKILLTPNTAYCVTLHKKVHTSGIVYLGADASSPTHQGNSIMKGSGSWLYDTEDVCFYIYGESSNGGEYYYYYKPTHTVIAESVEEPELEQEV